MTRPKVSETKVRQLLMTKGLPTNEEPVAILAARGYYRDTMGRPGQNDVGIYDDAMFLVAPGVFKAVNANTDPSRLGWNPGVGKPYAMLLPGVWFFRRGAHKGKVPALRQCTDEEAALRGIPNDGQFSVLRVFGEGDHRNYLESDYFAINIHSGGESTTSSWGCQTIPPGQFEDFMLAVWEASKAAGQDRIPYMLTEGPIV